MVSKKIGTARRASQKGSGVLRVAELFAGVGGFHLGLKAAGMETVWANQWEPGTKSQFAYQCYEAHFPGICVNDDIGQVLNRYDPFSVKKPQRMIHHHLLCGGFPCQDYSVAKTLSHASGIEGKKGVLWWQIHRWLVLFKPKYVLLENVDRLLKSPANQRGRDFAIILACLCDLGYTAEWRVINAAEYGFPQKRRRVFIVGCLEKKRVSDSDATERLFVSGIIAKAFPVGLAPSLTLFGQEFGETKSFKIDGALNEISVEFGRDSTRSPFQNAGIASKRQVWTARVEPFHDGQRTVLRDILQPEEQVPGEFKIERDDLEKWRYLKGAKSERRVHRASGTVYHYVEGAIPFPDKLDEPARTILTGEGGSTPSRFKHIITVRSGKYRRLTCVELERLNGFPDNWTATGMSSGRRAFCMGNALVVGVVARLGKSIREHFEARASIQPAKKAASSGATTKRPRSRGVA